MATDASEPISAAFGDLIDLHATPVVAPNLSSSPAQRQGEVQQQPQREAEQHARQHAARTGQRLCDLGWLWREVADLFHVAGRTLRQWCHDLLHPFRPPCTLGRPRVRSSRDERNRVIHFLDEYGPGIGVPSLRDCFPKMPRVELEDLLKRYRRVWRERHRVPLRVLTWPVVGRVWAIDYAEPPQPINGRYSYLLAARDLASGMQLLWQPVEAATGEHAARAMATLFATYGAPLVLKSDNGSHFTCDKVQGLLRANQVEFLFSPPHWPRYNGGIEAGIHSLKDRTLAHAARAGRSAQWTTEDTLAALHEMNEIARPHGENAPSPEQAWRVRTAINSSERDTFAENVAKWLDGERKQGNACETETNGVWSQREMAREAIRHALEECGYLHYQRRRILPHIPRPKAEGII